mgnify:CR=1 FL=1
MALEKRANILEMTSQAGCRGLGARRQKMDDMPEYIPALMAVLFTVLVLEIWIPI